MFVSTSNQYFPIKNPGQLNLASKMLDIQNIKNMGESTSIALLPQAPDALLLSPSDRLRVLKLKKKLIEETILALEDFFVYRKMSKFDAHVGETLCQIRAYHIYLLANNLKFCDHAAILENITALKKLSVRLATIIQCYQENSYQREEHQKISDFLQERNVICNLSELSIYLTQLHLLAGFISLNAAEDVSIDYQKMCAALDISKHTARRIVHLYQVNVSVKSTCFIYQLMMERTDARILQELFEDFIKTDEDGRSVLPSYWVMKILYNNMLQMKCPILVICKRHCWQKNSDPIYLVFKKSTTNKFDYEYCPLEDSNVANFYFVLEGIVHYEVGNAIPTREQYIQSFINLGIKNILFANMAIHPQYSGKKLRADQSTPFLNLLEEKNNLNLSADAQIMLLKNLHRTQQVMCEYAKKIGCGKHNPAFFYIRHIFCDTLYNQLQIKKLYEVTESVA